MGHCAMFDVPPHLTLPLSEKEQMLKSDLNMPDSFEGFRSNHALLPL